MWRERRENRYVDNKYIWINSGPKIDWFRSLIDSYTYVKRGEASKGEDRASWYAILSRDVLVRVAIYVFVVIGQVDHERHVRGDL